VTWTIRIPGRHSDPLNEKSVFDLSNAIDDPDERAVARALLLAAWTSGAKTVGTVVRGVERLNQSDRRRLLDVLRRDAGLADTKTVEAEREFARANKAGAVIAGQHSPWQICHGVNSDGGNCNAIPMSHLGVPEPTPVRRWFCPAHRHLAQPGDMEERGSGTRISASGALVPVDPGTEERAAAERASRRRQLEAEAAIREPEAEAARAHARARDEELEALLPWNQARR
jgi:hypothetical protein